MLSDLRREKTYPLLLGISGIALFFLIIGCQQQQPKKQPVVHKVPKPQKSPKTPKAKATSTKAHKSTKHSGRDYEIKGFSIRNPPKRPTPKKSPKSTVQQKAVAFALKLHKKIKKHFKVPKGITEKQEKLYRSRVQVMLSIDKYGGIGNLQLKRSSGSFLFDNALLDAVRRSAPYPQPPEEILDLFEAGILIKMGK